MSENRKMPVVFVGHGSPMNAIEGAAREGWKNIGAAVGKPEVIIAVSAHWASDRLSVRSAADNPQINDMYGFPDELYSVRYSPAGSEKYAARALALLGGDASADNGWGIDHGIWTVLSNMYPRADVPVVMVGVNAAADAEFQFGVGKRLAPLRDEGAMIIASGNVVHNLRLVDWDMADGFPWADRFDGTVKKAILSGDFKTPVGYGAIPDSAKAVPTAEHYYPLLTALGAASDSDAVTVFNDYRELGSMSMTSYLFEAQN
jgi:4,5-DOPA dioxygenase extradiol